MIARQHIEADQLILQDVLGLAAEVRGQEEEEEDDKERVTEAAVTEEGDKDKPSSSCASITAAAHKQSETRSLAAALRF